MLVRAKARIKARKAVIAAEKVKNDPKYGLVIAQPKELSHREKAEKSAAAAAAAAADAAHLASEAAAKSAKASSRVFA
jgi:hypothetical protein